eukprot:g40727.t1
MLSFLGIVGAAPIQHEELWIGVDEMEFKLQTLHHEEAEGLDDVTADEASIGSQGAALDVPLFVQLSNSIKPFKWGGGNRERSCAKKAQQHLFFLRQLRKFALFIRSLTIFYRSTIESTLSRCITAWYGNCSAQDHKELQKVVCTAQTITKANLPSMDSIYTARCCGKVANIIKDPSHP